ncbi:MAG: DUF5666 domain-containing protein [Vicinamibacterales bacterium]
MPRFRHLAAVLLTAGTIAAAACSDSPARLSPTGPSPVPGAPALAGDTALTAAKLPSVPGPVRDAATVSNWAARSGWAATAGLAVEGTDVISGLAGACPAVTLTVRGVPVSVDATTSFGPGTTCAGLAIGDTVHIRGLLFFDAGAFSVVATEVTELGDPGGNTSPPGPTPPGPGPQPGGEIEGEGRVASVSGICPDLTFRVENYTVATSAATVFEPAGGCAAIAPGVKVEAKGTYDAATGQIAARVVEVRTTPGGRHAEGEGTVASLTGTCPAVSMVVRGTRVTTSADTTFVNGACDNLRPGTKVEVKGTLGADGGLTADSVEIKDQPGHGPGGEVEGEGTIGTITGACPSLTMVIRGMSVMTSGETAYVGGTCADLASGVTVEVRGTAAGNALMADEVRLKPHPDGAPLP